MPKEQSALDLVWLLGHAAGEFADNVHRIESRVLLRALLVTLDEQEIRNERDRQLVAMGKATVNRRLDLLAAPRLPDADRERLGRVVRDAWMRWAAQHPDPKPSWLVPWDGLNEMDREVDRQIAEAVLAAQSAPVEPAGDLDAAMATMTPVQRAETDLADSIEREHGSKKAGG